MQTRLCQTDAVGPDQPGLEECPGLPPPFLPRLRHGWGLALLCSVQAARPLTFPFALDHTRLGERWNWAMEQWCSWSQTELVQTLLKATS